MVYCPNILKYNTNHIEEEKEMKIYNRELDLPLRNAGYDFICPQCKAAFAFGGSPSKLTIKCPECKYYWRIQYNGHPKTKVQTP